MAKAIVSKRFQLNKADLIKIGRGALVAVSGALVIYAVEILPNIDFGDAWWVPMATALTAVLVNALRKLVTVNKY